MGKSGCCSGKTKTDTQISLSLPVSSNRAIVIENNSTNTPVPTQSQRESGQTPIKTFKGQFLTADCLYGECHGKVRPCTESI